MRLIALCSFYAEPPEWLTGMAASLHTTGIDHLIALDGAYLLYPGGHHHSTTDQHAALTETCTALGLGLTIHIPQTVWLGNEVQKRNHLFKLATVEAEPDEDWLLVIDADEHVSTPDHYLKHTLQATDLDVATVTLRSPLGQEPVRRLFRAIPGITVTHNHFTYQTPDGRYLWGSPEVQMEPAADIPTLELEHRQHQRDKPRNQARHQYYTLRDDLKVEQPSNA